MRVSDDRYSRDRQRMDVALRFIRHEARTRTIRTWTGLTDDRIRKLYRFYVNDLGGAGPTRHRGKSPQQIHLFMRSARMRQETALLASLCCLTGLLPLTPAEARLTSPSLTRAELLCQAYESYRALMPAGQLSFEHAVLLLAVLARGDELVVAVCADCRALLIADHCALRAPRCTACAEDSERAQHDPSAPERARVSGRRDA